ncbi:MAG: isoprenylcysteine carboxylmethyltransferase family protein [Deltaproteobacteria bacterium]|nr:isoprenylcysteine carboxylmethyltransferase family protein [Deltaproteobacteria bacterium]
MEIGNAYGLWGIVLVNSLIILLFAFSFFRPKTRRDWRTFGAFSAFITALFTEMYGFPLTIYLLSGWLGTKYPQVDWLSHDSGHILQTILGWEGDAHLGPLHMISNIMLIGGFVLLAVSWKVLYNGQKRGDLATVGPYAWVRHPQYVAFIIIMVSFLIQWPTVVTVAMFPVLVWTYFRLALREEREVLSVFGERYSRYAKNTPRFIPRIGRKDDSTLFRGIE